MNNGWNPVRRNRNIGTSKQGYGQNNKLKIPQPLDTLKSFYERFEDPEITKINVHGKEIIVIVEKLNPKYFYSCNSEDIQTILNNIPLEDLDGFGIIVFRQPKKKETYLSPVWGRLIYSFEFNNEFHPAIIIEATPRWKKYTFEKKQSVERAQEFQFLQSDGMKFKEDKREYVAEINEDTIRNVQLHRTLLHEIGHYVHYLEVVERPGNEEEEYEEWEKRNDLYFKIPTSEKESFANNYAAKMKSNLLEKEVIPIKKPTIHST